MSLFQLDSFSLIRYPRPMPRTLSLCVKGIMMVMCWNFCTQAYCLSSVLLPLLLLLLLGLNATKLLDQ